MDKNINRRINNALNGGASGRFAPIEFDDVDFGRLAGSFQSFADEANWKNNQQSQHYINDHFGYRHTNHGWEQNIDNQDDYRKNYFSRGLKNDGLTDSLIQEDVSKILLKSPDVNDVGIKVDAKDGIVILTGSIDSEQMKLEAELLIESIPGVVNVRNLLTAMGDEVS